MRPHISIVIPALGVNERLRAALESWRPLADRLRVTFILVIDREDGLDARLPWAETLIRICPRPDGWIGRDANLRRNEGLVRALALDTDLVLFTDSKVRGTGEAIDRLVEWAATPGRLERVQALAGAYVDPSIGRGMSRLIALYADHAMFRKNPRFPAEGVRLSRDGAHHCDSWPVTGALLLTRPAALALHAAGGLPSEFRVSYEDYAAVQVMLDSGVEITCDGRFLVEHGNRRGLVDLVREYMRTGWAAAQFRRRFPHSAFGLRRRTQALATLLALAAFVMLGALAPVVASAVAVAGIALFGVVNAAIARRIEALAFGPVFCLSALGFASGFAHYHLRRGQLRPDDARLYAMH